MPTTTDPFYADVLCLLHGAGADGSTAIVDSGPAARPITRASGNVRIQTAVFDLPPSAIYGGPVAGGVNGVLAFDVGADAASTEWTWEARINRRVTADAGLLQSHPDANIVIGHGPNAGANRWGWNGAMVSTTELLPGIWYSLAITGTAVPGGNGLNRLLRLFTNGVLEAEFATQSGVANLLPNRTYRIGPMDQAGFANLDIYFQEWRLTKRCRYTESYTPEAAPFADTDAAEFWVGSSNPWPAGTVAI